jgi:hypothetical protein
MFLKDTYSQRRLEKLFHSQVLGVIPFEELHDNVMAATKKAGVIDANFTILYTIRETDVEGQGRMEYTIILGGTRGFLFRRPVAAVIQFESSCEYVEPVLVEASTQVNDSKHEVVTHYKHYIGQGRGRRTIPGTDYLV